MKTLSLRIAACLLLAASLLLVACQSSKSSTASKMLRFNFENGKGYDYEMQMSMDQNIQGAGPMKMDMLFYYSLDVTGDDVKTKNVHARYDRFKLNMDVAGMSIDVDTDKPATEEKDGNEMNKALYMMDKLFGAIKGKEFNMKINGEGKVEEVTGFKEMIGSMLDSMGLEGADRDQAMQQFNQQFSEEKSKAQFERLLYIFPDKEVKVGDSWTRSTTASGMSYDSKYTVKEIEGDMVTLDEETKVDADRGGKHITGNLTGTVIVDSRSGLIVKSDQDMELKNESPAFTLHLKTSVKGKAR